MTRPTAVWKAKLRLTSEIASLAHCRGRAEAFDERRSRETVDQVRLFDESIRKWRDVDAADARVTKAISAHARAVRADERRKREGR